MQGIEYYRDADPDETVPGLMHVDLGGYHVSDIEFSAAFDVDAEKVGKDLGSAIFSGQNNTVKFSDVPDLGVKVQRGMTHDGLGKYLRKVITKAPGETADVVDILRATKTDVVVSYLPGGLRGGHQVVRRAGARRRLRLRQLRAGVHRPRGVLAPPLRDRPACRSSATTSSRRSARRSCTASSPACSRTAACCSSAPTS